VVFVSLLGEDEDDAWMLGWCLDDAWMMRWRRRRRMMEMDDCFDFIYIYIYMYIYIPVYYSIPYLFVRSFFGVAFARHMTDSTRLDLTNDWLDLTRLMTDSLGHCDLYGVGVVYLRTYVRTCMQSFWLRGRHSRAFLHAATRLGPSRYST
jgi:hypothetical protein